MEEVAMQEVPTRVVSYAGFWKRFVAYLIDAILLCIVSMVLFVPLLSMIGLGALGNMLQDESDPSAGYIFALVGTYMVTIVAIFVAGWLYYALMESSSKGATLGKMALGLRVTDLQGNNISFGRATGRYFGKILSGLILYVGFLMAGFTQQKQALHDILSGCLVVNK
jgi:uncharacterized RDD family membrane protein YckC